MDDLPTCLVHSLLLEWLSPETVWTAVRASAVLRRHAQMPGAMVMFRAAPGEVLSDPCVRWFRHWRVNLVLWTYVERNMAHYRNGKLHRDDDLPAVHWSDDGMGRWFQDGLMHRDGDKPAEIVEMLWYFDSSIHSPIKRQSWYQRGKQHRDGDLPAEIWANGAQVWYKDDEAHRGGDLPAVVNADGTLAWYKHGKLHREEDKPAIIYMNGTQKWYQNGGLHREEDKPAIVWSCGTLEWWVNGTRQKAATPDADNVDVIVVVTEEKEIPE